MELNSRIYVAGHRGLAGSAIVRRLLAGGYSPQSLVLRTHAELDLTDQRAVNGFFEKEKPEYVFLAAAKVGGIHANNTYRADFIYQNLMIESNIIHASYRHGVKKLMFLGSSCIYPKHAPQPMKEEHLLTGLLEPTNEPYAIAKIAGIKMCDAYNRQYGTNFLSVMPTNLYGLGDNYDLENSHVIPALIRKTHEAKIQSQVTSHKSPVVIWGTGTPRREFLYSEDLADACVFLMNLSDERFQSLITSHESPPLINIGSGEDHTIHEFAELVAEAVGYDGRFTFDAGKPDGTPRKLLDVSRMKALGWQAKTTLREGLSSAYQDYLLRTQAAARSARGG
jgi:GDP-L-fucose synthase